ncbi:GNAT family N-acetyltransferase [Streptococcus mutans]|uniref:GNAT family N-acetyltransferase n=1 Tax=Streptococcus mutans TaxID=1309 RepID=UPI000463E80D|nr:GNAT family N-acetyltransferase [Streptococcus mutans]MCB4932521.1 GNAT family N-acetyltransferase [Streptococcus mutans]
MAVKEPLTIREYRPEDLEALLPLYEQLGYPTRTDELRDRLAGLLSHEDYHLLVAECDGQLVAFIGYARMYFFEHDGSYYRILALAVSEDYRRQGIASRLLDAAKAKALSEGAKALVLNSGMVPRRKGAHTFYETYGFEKASYGFAFDLS